MDILVQNVNREECKDEKSENFCARQKKNGKCDKNNIANLCKLTCGKCSPPTTTTTISPLLGKTARKT